jgi:DNA-binding response OmpR family regulator
MRVLVVEDDKALQHSLLATLRNSGFQTRSTHLGEEALALEAMGDFDVAILDVGLPDIDGFEILTELRKRGSTTPILMLTARDGVSDRVAGLDLGADDYLVKPFAPAELVARIRAVARRRPGKGDTLIEIGRLVCDWESGRARIGENELSLRPREWSALRVLASRVGQVVDREMLAAKSFNRTSRYRSMLWRSTSDACAASFNPTGPR